MFVHALTSEWQHLECEVSRLSAIASHEQLDGLSAEVALAALGVAGDHRAGVLDAQSLRDGRAHLRRVEVREVFVYLRDAQAGDDPLDRHARHALALLHVLQQAELELIAGSKINVTALAAPCTGRKEGKHSDKEEPHRVLSNESM